MGQRLAGRYRLDRLIANGGMAQVWEAEDEVLSRPVAVKLLHATWPLISPSSPVSAPRPSPPLAWPIPTAGPPRSM